MEACVTPYPETSGEDEAAGGEWKSFPERLNAVPSRISSDLIPGVSAASFREDNRSWKKHVNAYKGLTKNFDLGRYRNIMDMNAGFGSFAAAALESSKLWVMNAMPTIDERDTLGVIYEGGLIGIYHEWCSMEDILLEVDHILRPEGSVIFLDQVDVLAKVKRIAGGMRWDAKLVDHEDGPLISQKILAVVQRDWIAGENNATSS